MRKTRQYLWVAEGSVLYLARRGRNLESLLSDDWEVVDNENECKTVSPIRITEERC
jgi:hypothetical protein